MKVQAQVSITSRLSSHENAEDEIKHRLSQQLAQQLIESDIVQITNRSDRSGNMRGPGFNTYRDQYHGWSDEETYIAEIFVNDKPFHRVPAIPDYTHGGAATNDNITLTPREAEEIWKLLPPRINGIKDSKHPLNPHWFGTIPKPRDEETRKRIQQLLKIND